MIVFDLCCPADHVFEAWFGSTGDYESQRRRGLVSCPICGAGGVEKAMMAPNVAAKGNRAPSGSRRTQPVPASAPTSTPVPMPMPMRNGPPLPAEMKAALASLAQAQAKALEGSEHVGRRFAEEARAIHAGDAPERMIHGQATPEEAKSLLEDGLPVAPLPFPVVPPEQLQ